MLLFLYCGDFNIKKNWYYEILLYLKVISKPIGYSFWCQYGSIIMLEIPYNTTSYNSFSPINNVINEIWRFPDFNIIIVTATAAGAVEGEQRWRHRWVRHQPARAVAPCQKVTQRARNESKIPPRQHQQQTTSVAR